MDDIKKNESKNNNLYLLKSLFLAQASGPTSEIFFVIFFSLKYIGLLVNARIVEMVVNKNTTSLNKYLRNFLIFGKNLSPILNNYHIITIIGATFLFFFILFFLLSIIYMKIKYGKIKTLIQEKIEMINEEIEKTIFNIICFIYITILFFHQYILEYYFLGSMRLFIIKLEYFQKMENFLIYI